MMKCQLISLSLVKRVRRGSQRSLRRVLVAWKVVALSERMLLGAPKRALVLGELTVSCFGLEPEALDEEFAVKGHRG